MSEVLEQLDVATEVIAPEQESANMSEAETAPEQRPVEPPKQLEDMQEKNWRAARAQMADQQRHIQTLQQELELVRKVQAPKEPEEEFLTDSERRLNDKIKILDQKLKHNEAKNADYVVDRLKSKYADFDDVVNPENITYLQTNNAALARALASLQGDPYEQGIAAYDVLKKTEWYQQRHTMQDKAKLDQNVKKPMSVQAVRKQGALSEANSFANGLTPELKKSLLAEMAQARKGA
jgi:hypothetical protein